MSLPQPMSWETNPQDGYDESPSDAEHNSERIIEMTATTTTISRQSGTRSSNNENMDRPESDNNSRDEDEQDNNKNNLSNSEILYSIESFRAMVIPVSLTMILSSLAVVYFNNEETIAAGEQASAQAYQVFDLEEGNTAQNLYASLGNTLMIVGVVCAMTFVVVLLYKYRWLKVFYGYMVLVTAVLLGYFTANMFIVAIEIYGWRVDKLSFAFVMYNYAVVGTVAIFFQRGIPRWVTQGYLITSSVVMAWQLSYFNDWLAWTLLVMLALYDLFAVLSPCGPLKALAKLISKPGAPQLPGLLYEANLPEGVKKPNTKSRNKSGTNDRQNDERPENRSSSDEEEKQPEEGDNMAVSDSNAVGEETSRTLSMSSSNETNSQRNSFTRIDYQSARFESNNESRRVESTSSRQVVQSSDVSQTPSQSCRADNPRQSTSAHESTQASNDMTRKWRLREDKNEAEIPDDVVTSNTRSVPLALAKLYKLSILDTKGVLRRRRFASTWQRFYTFEELKEGEWSPKQLRSEVTGIFPARGGYIEKAEDQKYDAGVAYIVYNRMGEEIRKFVVTHEGKVKQVLRRDPTSDENNDCDEPNSIKLGIGDFVFYSVLVAKAAQYSFTAFATCFFVVLMGLAGTLMILAIKGKALPALPISIFLGVIVFLATRELIQPWIRDVLRQNFYA